MSLRQNKLFKQTYCFCKHLNPPSCDRAKFLANQKRYFSHHEKANGRVQVGVLGAPIECGQVSTVLKKNNNLKKF